MLPKRTIRRPTRWTPAEWSRVLDAARTQGMPPLRFVREVVLASTEPGACPLPAPPASGWVELMEQFSRVLNNLHQLHGVAEDAGDVRLARMLGDTIERTEQAVVRAPSRPSGNGSIVDELVRTGRLLNEMAHQAHASEALPSLAEAAMVLGEVNGVVGRVLP